MSLVPGRQFANTEDPAHVAQYLIRYAGLGEDALQAIAELRAREELRFSEAALRLGLVTQADVDAALGASRNLESGRPARAQADAQLVVAHDPFHPHSEQIRVLRTAVLMRQGEAATNVLAVVSSQRGEGRSRLAAELAISCAQLNQPTLLVDADMRNPGLHRLFGLDNARGLANALAETAPPQLHGVNGLPQLTLLTAGRAPGNPLELLSSDALDALLVGWRRRYRHIVFDTPAVASYSDALAVANHAGAALPLARLHRTPTRDWKTLIQRLHSTRARVLGGVLNRI